MSKEKPTPHETDIPIGDTPHEAKAEQCVEWPSDEEVLRWEKAYRNNLGKWPEVENIFRWLRANTKLRSVENVRLERSDEDDAVFNELYEKYGDLKTKAQVLVNALELIAAPKRNDGTYNRCREACEELAREALKKYREEG